MKKHLLSIAVELLKMRAVGHQTNEGLNRAAVELLQKTMHNEVERLKAKEEAVQKEVELQSEAKGVCHTCQG